MKIKKRWVYTDKSVRDLHQQVILKRGIIKVISHCGRRKCGEYIITLKEWLYNSKQTTFNIAYNQLEFIRSKTRNYDIQSGGVCQADRIRLSQIRAINKILRIKKREE